MGRSCFRLVLAFATFATFALHISVAAAQTRMLEQQSFGVWTYRATQVVNRNQNVCAVLTESSDGARYFRVIMGSPPLAFFISIGNSRWNIPPQAEGDVRFEIDGRPPVVFRARRLNPNALSVDLARERDRAFRFLDGFRQGNRMRIVLPNGDSMSVGLQGTNAALGRFFSCFQRYINVQGNNPMAPRSDSGDGGRTNPLVSPPPAGGPRKD